jgi:phytol kinase
MTMSIFAAVVAELGILIGLLIGLRLLSHRYAISPETLRKLFHLGGGLTTLAFPWIFPSYVPVLLLALITIPALLALKYVRALRTGLGSVLYGIRRASFGEIYFPISVCLLFILANHQVLLYSIPVLTLTFADTAAAMVGKRFGRRRYPAPGGYKSLEGSSAFFVVACVCSLVPLAVGIPSASLEALFIALTLAFLMTLVEAVSFGGLDNLLIPLLGYLFLRSLLVSDFWTLWLEVELAGGLLVMAMVIAMVMSEPRRSRPHSSGEERSHVF